MRCKVCYAGSENIYQKTYSEVQLNTFTQLGADNTTEEYLHAIRDSAFHHPFMSGRAAF